MSVQYYTASSLDGFIADSDNSLAWLLSRDIDQAGPMSYPSFFDGVGAIVMGATTYEWIRENNDARWDYDVPCWVFTHRDPEPYGGDVRFVSGSVSRIHPDVAAAAAGANVWLAGGGDLVGQFHDAGLLDEVWVQYAPVTLGSGAPLLPRRIEFEPVEVARNREFVCARYRVVR